MTGVIADVNVTLFNITHAFPDDLDVLLVGPAGQKVFLMSDAGCNYAISGVNLTFDQSAGTPLPDDGQIVTGTYLPSNYDNRCGGFVADDGFPPDAPDGPYDTSLDVFNGTDPKGDWNLYVVDDAAGDSGSIAGGWALEITTVTAPVITSPPTATVVVGSSFSHTFTATGDPVPQLSYNNSTFPPEITLVGDTLFGTPTAPGTYSIEVTANNAAGQDTQIFTLTVTDDAPVITSRETGRESFVPPPPVPICNEVGKESSAIVRAQVADGTVSDGGVFCRVLVENGSFRGDPGQMGDLRLIELGIVQAVDVFGLMAGGQAIVPFNQPVYVCLRGTGVLYYADASNAPRIYSQIASVVQDGFT